MAVINDVGNALTGSTGTGAFVGNTSPTVTTPVIATSLSFSPTTGGIVGTPTNNNAAAGVVGEYVTSQILSTSSVPFTTNTARNITSISLTAGDWDVFGNVSFGPSVGCQTAFCWVSVTSATAPDGSLFAGMSATMTAPAIGLTTPYVRISISSTTTVFLSAQAGFVSGTVAGSGGIFARRVR